MLEVKAWAELRGRIRKLPQFGATVPGTGPPLRRAKPRASEAGAPSPRLGMDWTPVPELNAEVRHLHTVSAVAQTCCQAAPLRNTVLQHGNRGNQDDRYVIA